MSMSHGDDERMLRRFMKKAKASGQKDYKKHDFLRLIVETAMEREKMDINTPNHIDCKLQKKIDDMRRRRPILVNPPQSKKPRFSISCQPPLIEKETNFKEVVQVEEKKVGLVTKDVGYEKEVMKKKKKNNDKKTMKKKKKNNGKKTTEKSTTKSKRVHKPLPLPNEEVCNLMLERIMQVGGTNPVWLTVKKITDSDMRPGLGRLFIRKCDALENFLTEEEKVIIKDREILGIPCSVVDQNGERWNLHLRFWPGVNLYVITNTPIWNQVIKHFGLSVKTPGKIELWSFRLPEENPSICFAMRITRL